MSLLTRGTDVVTVYPEEMVIDSDGNKITKPSKVGVVCRAVVQPISTSEDENAGQVATVTKHRLRLVGWHGAHLGAQSQVEWNGKRYAIDGDPMVYNGSPRTARVEYRMVRR